MTADFRESDPKCNKKKRHIGNNFVTIVYNDRGVPSEPYEFSMIKGQFNYACIVVTPIDQGSNRVEIKCRPELNEPLGHVKVSLGLLSACKMHLGYSKRKIVTDCCSMF